VAPEFLGFFLAAAVLVACAVVAMLVVSRRRHGLQKLALLGLVPTLSVLLLLIVHLRQEFFLNEPMAIAAHQGELHEVRRLLDRGASPNSWGVDCVDTALTGAADAGHVSVVQLLIDRGANLNLPNSQGRTPLSCARSRGHKEVEEALLKAGAKAWHRP
jgi:hypothetical protein